MSDPSTDFAASRDELRDTYARFAGHEQRRKQIWQVLNRHFFERWVEPDDTVLDLGAGYCEFINSARARRNFALDLSSNTSQQAAPGVQVISQDITQQWAVEPASGRRRLHQQFSRTPARQEGFDALPAGNIQNPSAGRPLHRPWSQHSLRFSRILGLFRSLSSFE